MARVRTYPQLTLIKDVPTQQSLQLLWDRLFEALDTIDTQAVTITAQQTALDAQVTQFAAFKTQTEIGSPLNSTPTDASGNAGFGGFGGGGTGGGGINPGGGSGGGDSGTIPGNDGGEGQAGLVQAGPTGHPDPPFTLDPFTMGRIVGGTGNEFPALLAATGSAPARVANLDELRERIIWHLQRAGFNAGRQRNPSGAISGDKITIQNQVNGIWLVYDIYPGSAQDNFAIAFNLQMFQTAPADTVTDGGTPD